MRKVVFLFAVIITAFFLLPGSAYAELKASSIQDVKIEYIKGDGDTYGDIHNSISAKIQVEWRVNAVPELPLSFNTDTIKIYKAVKDTGKIINQFDFEIVDEININDRVDDEGYHTMLWEDTNITVGKQYQYEVTCGSVAAKKGKTPLLTIRTEEDKENEETDITNRQDKYEETADWPERMAASIVLAPAKYIIDVIGLDDPIELIFQANMDGGADALQPTDVVIDEDGNEIIEEDGSDLYFYTFSENEFNAISHYFEKLSEFIPISLVVIVVLMALGILYISVNPNSQVTFKEYLIGLLLGLLALKVGVYIISVVFEINYAIIKFFQFIVGDKLTSSYLDYIIDTNGLTLGSAILTCIGIFSIGILNWQYVVRKIVLGILIGILPLVAMISIMPSRRNAIGYWMKEFFSQVFLQSSHAAVLSLALLFIGTQTGFWVQLAVLLGLPMMAKLIREIFGAESPGSGMVGGVGAAMGLGALFSLGKIFKNKKGSGSKAVEGASNVTETTGQVAGQATQNVATNSSKSLMQGVARKGLKVAGGATTGMAGGMLSAALTGNPVAGFAGAIGGASIGSSIGDRVSDVADTSTGLFTMSQEDKNQAMGISDSAQLNDPSQAYDAGKKLYGGGVVGAVAGTGMAAKSSLKAITDREGYNTAKQVKTATRDNMQQLSQAKQNLSNYQPVYEKSKADFNRAKSLYSKDSTHLAGLQEKAKTLEGQKNGAEQEYVEALNEWNNDYLPETETGIWTSESHEAYDRLQSAETKFNNISSELNQTQTEIETGQHQFNEKKQEFQTVNAEYNSRQAEVNRLEYKVSNEGIREELMNINPKLRNDFHNVKQPPQQTSGGIHTSWR